MKERTKNKIAVGFLTVTAFVFMAACLLLMFYVVGLFGMLVFALILAFLGMLAWSLNRLI